MRLIRKYWGVPLWSSQRNLWYKNPDEKSINFEIVKWFQGWCDFKDNQSNKSRWSVESPGYHSRQIDWNERLGKVFIS